MQVAGEEPVTSVPPVVQLPRVDVPLGVALVPVDVDEEDRASRTSNHLYHHPLSTLQVESYVGHQSPPVLGTNYQYFLKKRQCTLPEAVAAEIPTFAPSKILTRKP